MKTGNRRELSSGTIIAWCILLGAFVLRIWGVTSVPGGINQDEAMGAVDAWALSQYGTDRYGMFLPVHFSAWQYSQMSVLLAYLMIPFIKVLGFNLWAIRLPMVLVSTMGVGLVYLIGKKLCTERTALIMMALAAINPWQYMQSRWALDCNLFPHVFLLGFWLLLIGLERKRYLYLSMVCFGLTFYCYGIAVYTVPVFLFVYAAWCLWQKQLKIKEVVLCVVIFGCVALPEIITMAINVIGASTIETPFFTMPAFPYSVRGADILFMNFSWEQLGKNIAALVNQVFLQKPDAIFNALPMFGPLYHISIPFMAIGIVVYCKRFFADKDNNSKKLSLALLGFLIMGLWAGVITKEVNVNRINIIFYPLIMLCAYGIEVVLQWGAKWRKQIGAVVTGLYLLCGVGFFAAYFTDFAGEIQEYFNVDFLEIVAEADALDYDALYITGNMGWQANPDMAQILTQYSCKIDARYYQELTNERNGREYLPYSERYHFVNMQHHDFADREAVYLIHHKDLEWVPAGGRILLENDSFLALTWEEE